MNRKIRFWAAAAASVLLLAGGGVIFRMVQERKATEAADAAQRAKWESAEQAAVIQNAGDQADAVGPDTPRRRQVDYAFFATNEYSEQNAFNRQQLFRNKELIYGGKRYLRHTGIRAVLLLGLDRTADDLMEERAPWEQGQTDAIFLLAHNTARNTVKILKIPRDTMAVMPGTNAENQVISEGIAQITLAYTAGNGVDESCRVTCEVVSRLLGGIPIDHYMLGDLNIVADVNDLVGGVTVRVPKDQTEWTDPAFRPGETITLHGKDAERFIRARNKEKSFTALERMERQQIYIIAFEKQLKQCLKNDQDIVEKMFDTMEGDMLTDMKRKEYVDLTLSILGSGTLSEKDFATLPGEPWAGPVYDEYHPHYADIDREILDLFYYESAQ